MTLGSDPNRTSPVKDSSMLEMVQAIGEIDTRSVESSSVMTSAIVGLNTEFRHMAGKLGEFVDESRVQHRDIELRLRTLESVIHAVERISGLDQRMETCEERLRIVEAADQHRRGFDTAIQVIIGAIAGLIGAAAGIWAVLRGLG